MALSLIPDASYRLANDTKVGNCSFHKGDVLTFSSGGYSPYDDCYVYHFMDMSGIKRICISQTKMTKNEVANFENIMRV